MNRPFYIAASVMFVLAMALFLLNVWTAVVVLFVYTVFHVWPDQVDMPLTLIAAIVSLGLGFWFLKLSRKE